MRFQNPEQPPPAPFTGRDRIMVFVVLAAVVVVFAMKLGSNPKFWSALKGKPSEAISKAKTLRDPDTRMLRPDEVLIPSASDANRAAPVLRSGPITLGDDLVIPKSALKSVKDNSLGIRAAEREDYYATLSAAAQTPLGEQTLVAKRIPYTMLMAEPWEHRGKLVTIKGRLRRLKPVRANGNSFDIQQLYDAWIFTDDSGSSPYHVVCTSIPSDLSPADVFKRSPPEVQVTGYFFKSQGYAAQGDPKKKKKNEVAMHSAPLLLASTMQMQAVAPVETRDIAAEMVPWLWWFAIGIGALLAVVLWNYAASDWTFRHTRAHGILRPETRPDFHGVDALSTEEMLRDLSRDGDISPRPYL